jgi:hypothetical protein
MPKQIARAAWKGFRRPRIVDLIFCLGLAALVALSDFGIL